VEKGRRDLSELKGGTLRRGAADDETRLAWYRRMVEIRVFENRTQELFQQGLVEGTTHLCQGQEATIVGAVSAMAPDDYMTITYRGHGHALARGMRPESAFAELMGRESGCCRGVGGSMHFADLSLGILGAFAIVGAGLPVALGAAMSSKRQRQGRVAVTFCGDGATNIGTFHETLNMAALWSAPIVFVVENNLYGEYTPLRESTPLEDLADRAAAYAIPGISIDGQDIDVVYDIASEAIERARGGGGPTLIEAKTYRYSGHSRSDPARYRPAGELDAWKQRDPIALLGAKLVGAGLQTAEDQAATWAQTQAEIDRSADDAARSPVPTIEEVRRYVYAH
jgi:TPP-dependent pyruvate/acetoin dehydrogenase alpha subunit